MTGQRRTHPGERRNGFTLVELAMTALLLSMGLLSVFALLRRGLESRIEMEAEVRAMLFADSLMNTLQAFSEHTGQDPRGEAWERFWLEFEAGEIAVSLHPELDAAGNVPGAEEDGEPWEGTQVTANGPTRRYRWVHTHGEPPGERWPDTALRYQCQVNLANTFGQDGFALANYPTNRVHVTVHIWPESAPDGASQTYFTLFSNSGRLP